MTLPVVPPPVKGVLAVTPVILPPPPPPVESIVITLPELFILTLEPPTN